MTLSPVKMTPTSTPSNPRSTEIQKPQIVPLAPSPSKSPSKSPSTDLPPKPLPTTSVEPKPIALSEAPPTPPPAIDHERVIINWEIFDQLLGLDDEGDDTRAFSKGTVQDYFEQASQKFEKMDKAVEKGHLEEVTDEAHSLKGSSAAIALSQVEATFGEIDRFRAKAKAWEGKDKLSEEDAREKRNVTEKIKALLTLAKKDNAAGKAWMEKWYEAETGIPDSF